MLMDDAGWKVEPEIILHDNDEFFFSIEPYSKPNGDTMVFTHLTVRKWTKEVFKKLITEWKKFRSVVTCPLFAVGGEGNTETWEHFVTRLGFKFVMPVICNNGQERRLFTHRIEKNKNNVQPVFHEPKFQPEH